MSTNVDQWQRARSSTVTALGRLLALLDGASPDLPVTKHWSIADMVAHLVTIGALDLALVRGSRPDLPVHDLGDLLRRTTVDTVADMNREIMGRFTERRLPVLTERLRADVEALLAGSEDLDPQHQVDWLGGSRVPVVGLIAHFLNELNIHAWDMARPLGRPWHTDPRDAALFIDEFLVGVTRCGYGRLLDQDRPAHPGSISVEFRPRVGTSVTLALTDGRVTVEPTNPRPDVRLSYDPVVLNLMLFGRVSRLRAAATGKVRVSGVRPWLLPRFMATMRLPS